MGYSLFGYVRHLTLEAVLTGGIWAIGRVHALRLGTRILTASGERKQLIQTGLTDDRTVIALDDSVEV